MLHMHKGGRCLCVRSNGNLCLSRANDLHCCQNDVKNYIFLAKKCTHRCEFTCLGPHVLHPSEKYVRNTIRLAASTVNMGPADVQQTGLRLRFKSLLLFASLGVWACSLIFTQHRRFETLETSSYGNSESVEQTSHLFTRCCFQ